MKKLKRTENVSEQINWWPPLLDPKMRCLHWRLARAEHLRLTNTYNSIPSIHSIFFMILFFVYSFYHNSCLLSEHVRGKVCNHCIHDVSDKCTDWVEHITYMGPNPGRKIKMRWAFRRSTFSPVLSRVNLHLTLHWANNCNLLGSYDDRLQLFTKERLPLSENW